MTKSGDDSNSAREQGKARERTRERRRKVWGAPGVELTFYRGQGSTGEAAMSGS
jgi:hypothetical protein